ncbi:hypothetical protein CLAFUW4_20053 [Fulvia fulva]|uniref:uncharacterized protein n=1 Tax=Passalora fulva TaxID=5499 RepID=UPI00285284CA|nr:uncharacterized protein CLAFUR5_20053 [Fulvia fulva]KAK4621694.1 hypothetical protein CLAFUR4_20053 [Fulvia fulva]KAK4623467.1 hypothetical protein CLAFUR0_20053 [Fulvia fulva]WMI38924.1 hypothetical protein CLAFUR5_20053 [Fulvia fulva]WPV16324.1 hypothetical protein CLAFUW4_20053 [Fulvia fulva]WPV31098.1 hypothetical protein CLAFUW7_20053 [Fulvia fulva]
MLPLRGLVIRTAMMLLSVTTLRCLILLWCNVIGSASGLGILQMDARRGQQHLTFVLASHHAHQANLRAALGSQRATYNRCCVPDTAQPLRPRSQPRYCFHGRAALLCLLGPEIKGIANMSDTHRWLPETHAE